MENAIWNALCDLLLPDGAADVAEDDSMKVYLHSCHEFDVVDDTAMTWLKIYLVQTPAPVLRAYQNLKEPEQHQSTTSCFFDLHEMTEAMRAGESEDALPHDELAILADEKPACVWLLEGNIERFVDEICAHLSYFADKRTEVYLLHERATQIMRAQAKLLTPVTHCAFWDRITRAPASDLDGEMSALKAHATALPRSIWRQTLIGFARTHGLPRFLDLRSLLCAQSPLLFQSEFWLSRRRARELLDVYGAESGLMHPEYEGCVIAERALAAKIGKESPRAAVGASLSISFQERLRECLQFSLEHPTQSAPPKLLLHNELDDLTHPQLRSSWITDYVMPIANCVGSTFVCALHLTDVFDKYVGVSEDNLRVAWQWAHKMTETYQWVILILSDLELLSRDEEGTTGVERNLVTSLLMHLDGIAKRNDRLAVIGVSKKSISCLDEALIRPGRLSCHIPVTLLS